MSTVTEVSICNSALVKIGSDTLNTLTEPNKRARLCKKLFNTLRDDVISAYPWNFAIKRAQLAQVSGVTPTFDFDFCYGLPSDVLRVLEVDEKDMVFKIEGRYLVTNEEAINIKYIAKVTDPSMFSMMFAEALAYRLAMELSYAITQNASLRDRMEKSYKDVLRDARTNDSQEGTPEDFDADDWLNSRK